MSDCRHNRSDYGLETGSVQNERQQFNGKTREQLVDELTDTLDGLHGDVDPDRIEELLEQIEQFGPILEDYDVEQSLQEFHDKFDVDSLDDEDETQQKKPRRRFGRMARIAIIAAALAGFVITAQGAGFSIFNAFVEWTSDKLHYITGSETNPDEAPEPVYMSLQEALDEYGVEEELSPQAFPENSELVEVTVRRMQGLPIFTAKYDVSGEELFMSIRQVEIDLQPEVEKNDSEEVYKHTVAGIEHQITADVKQTKAVWRNGVWECKIKGTLDRETLIAMIDSIYD